MHINRYACMNAKTIAVVVHVCMFAGGDDVFMDTPVRTLS
ncbi:Uncharacterised protein [Escherichia coli]|uniref:Uncharacterized protein n=1 Tax=Escherichia coli TaxID=562 RepID=A0A3S4LK83_ECOLX|nr:Uncharacterised protein [Escherichia coli]